MKSLGVDVGGTFTDLVYCDMTSGAMVIHKVSTTPHDPAVGVMEGIVQLCALADIAPADIAYVFHGTTTATNAVLENKGAKTGLITNNGFRDVLHIGRHQRVEHYSIMQDLPWQSRPLIARRYRKTVAGRLTPPTGAELVALDEAGVRRAAQELKAEGVDSVAVCFLFSYLNPAHENRAADIVRAEMPDAFVTTSSFLSPQFREFERFTTAALAAFIGPRVGRYVAHLETALRGLGITGELRIMASNGGVATAKMVTDKPALTLMSGLAAGVLGGRWVGEQTGHHRLITFDIGGTSADIGIIVDGNIVETDARSTSIAGFPLLMPMLDIHTIGAGGGSIAHLDRGGAFRVGPQSAGAVPGPAAYGRGGDFPTVTDANVVLGRLAPADFLGGAMTLDPAAAHRVIETLAVQLNLPVMEAAEGVLTILNANMANAIRSRTIQKGIDPRGFALVAMGGAGPLHGVEVAQMLDIPTVIVPPYPGITSAMGLLTTDLKYDAVRTLFQVSDALNLDKNDIFIATGKFLGIRRYTATGKYSTEPLFSYPASKYFDGVLSGKVNEWQALLSYFAGTHTLKVGGKNIQDTISNIDLLKIPNAPYTATNPELAEFDFDKLVTGLVSPIALFGANNYELILQAGTAADWDIADGSVTSAGAARTTRNEFVWIFEGLKVIGGSNPSLQIDRW